MGIKAKILTPALVITLIVAVAIMTSNIIMFSSFVESSMVGSVDAATRVVADRLELLKAEAESVSLSMSRHPDIVNALAAGDRGALLAHARALQNESDIEFCTITDSDGFVIVRTHEPDIYGDSVLNQVNIQTAAYGESLTVIEEGSQVRLSVRSGSPVFNGGGDVIGIVSTGFRLDTNDFVDKIKETMGCEVSIVLGDERIASTILGANGVRIVGTKADAGIVKTVLAGSAYSGRVDIEGNVAVCEYTPIDGPDGQPIGMVFVGQYLEEETRTITAFVQGGLAILLIMLAASTVIFLYVVGRIVTPIRIITAAASALAVGDTDLDIQIKTKDETRTLANAFMSMIGNTRRQVELVESIAGGDMTIRLEPRSEKDLMNRALEKLNATIKAQAAEIRGEHERIRLMFDATPMVCRLWDRNYNMIECNEAVVSLFGLKNKQEYLENYVELSPKYQPDGRLSLEKQRALIHEAFEKGVCTYEWTYRLPDGTPVPAECIMVRVPYGNDFVIAGYARDLREHNKMMAGIKKRDDLLKIVNEAADILLRTEPEVFEGTLLECMGMMAREVGADRMRVIKNHFEDGLYYRTLLHEWYGNVPPMKGTSFTTQVSYLDTTPALLEKMLRRETIHSLVMDMPESDQVWFKKQGVLSILMFPVFTGDEFWGMVGFDNCHDEKLFAEAEAFIIPSGGMIVANALLRNESLLSIRNSSVQLEAALADAKLANNAKSNFLAQMSHEIRTPLNAVVGLSQLALENETIDAELEDRLEKIHNSGITILSIVNDILDISKIESGKFEIYPAKYDTPSMINDVVTLTVVRIGDKPVKFNLHLDENLPGVLYGDDLRVKQIFNNLLSNAFKYTNAGTVDWHVGFERDGGSVWLVSDIRDTGIGMKPEALGKLFSDYIQVDAATNRKVEGTGLGLAIGRRLAEMMDGGITVESEYGKGTVFHVRLRQGFVSGAPIGKTTADNLKNLRYRLVKRDKNAASRINLSYARVLVVDDIATNLDVVKGMMKPYKMQIDCAASGPQAIEMMRAGSPRYNAVFMDHMMPGMDGIEATRIIREVGTDYTRDIPIIALTANAIVGNEDMFLSKGFQAFLSKPIDTAKLDAVLRRWVRNSGATKDAEALLPEAVSLSGCLRIKGVDVEKAIERFGGDMDSVIDVLRSYASGTRPLLNTLRDYIENENLSGYAITVHGVKGSSYGILAQDVGKLAEELEKAANAGDMDAVKSGHGRFETVTEALLDEIDKALGAAGRDLPAAVRPDSALLSELREAAAAFDMDSVDSAMERLESFKYENGGELILWLRQRVDLMEFEEIAELKLPFNR